MTEAISCSKLSKSFGNRTLFKNVSLNISRGESIALLGHSGSGKSTLLHCLSGIESFNQGQVSISGKVINSMDQDALDKHRRHTIGTVFQFFHLLPTLSAFENIELSLQLISEKKDAIKPRVMHLMDRLGISSRANAFPREMSGGEKQRVAIARAIAHRPQVIFADEPTGNLDLKSGEDALRLLQEICREEDAALFMVTHSEKDAAICDKRFILENETLLALA